MAAAIAGDGVRCAHPHGACLNGMNPLLDHAKWALYRSAEIATDWLGGRRPCAMPTTMGDGVPALTVFASTIGELNAIAPLLRALRQKRPANPLWLVSDHAHYRDSFLRAWPGANFFAIDHHSDTAREFFKRVRTGIFMLAEIPLLPGDAPARLPFAWLRFARQSGACTTLANGWLYDEAPSCRMDKLERALFGRDQLRHLDLITVQDAATRGRLIARGAAPHSLHAVGNLKFDADPTHTRAAPLITNRPTIVAGSMNNLDEYRIALDAFTRVQHERPDCALILAPRHPENTARTDALCTELAHRGLHAKLRSQRTSVEYADCLILDTLGELAGAYQHAHCTHVGINHNVLEPLLHNKPVSVCPGWQARYPSFGVYQEMKKSGLIKEAIDAESLAALWLAALAQPAPKVLPKLKQHAGATDRTLALWQQAGWI